MKIVVNGKTHHFEKGMTIAQLLQKLQIDRGRNFAVAHNQSVVPKTRLGDTVVKDGDQLEIINATAGG